METLKAIEARKSVRGFTSELVTDEEIEIILEAANAAPVAMGDFEGIALTVIQNKALIDKIATLAVRDTKRAYADIFYGAPTLLLVSSVPPPLDALAFTNAGTIAQTVMLAATDIGLDSVYVFGALQGFANDSSLIIEAQIPDGYTPIASIALGHGTPEALAVPKKERSIITNRV